MPELPEVETICRGLAPQLEGCSIAKAKIFTKKIRIDVPRGLAAKITGQKIIKVIRKAKYILIYFENDLVLIVHLGMSGRFILHKSKRSKKIKHDHMIIDLDNGSELVFNDPRRFGLISLLKDDEINDSKFFKHLGHEPLAKDFKAELLFEICKKRNKSIKNTLMDSTLLVGVGNIYACESLFLAGINPERLASSLSKNEVKKIFEAVQFVLN